MAPKYGVDRAIRALTYLRLSFMVPVRSALLAAGGFRATTHSAPSKLMDGQLTLLRTGWLVMFDHGRTR